MDQNSSFCSEEMHNFNTDFGDGFSQDLKFDLRVNTISHRYTKISSMFVSSSKNSNFY